MQNEETQLHLAQTARYFVGTGLFLADDFLARIDAEKLRKANTKAAYIVRINKPVPAWFFVFGIGVAMAPDCGGCCKAKYLYSCPVRTTAECWGLGQLMLDLDFEHQYGLCTERVFIDLKEAQGRIVQIPKDEDVVRLHWAFQEANSNQDKKKKASSTVSDEKMRRGLRALDKRRWVEAGLVPPPERYSDLKKIQASAKKTEYEEYTEDEGDQQEEEETTKSGGTHDVIKDLFGEQEPDEAACCSSEGKESAASSAAGPRFATPSSNRPQRKNLQEVLRAIRAQSRKEHRRQLGTSQRRANPSSEYTGGDDTAMEQDDG